MKLNEISNNPGAHKHKHKVGRGSSSGLGKTSGRGVKGAKARTGTKVYGFEGGQMPLHMRMPKRGFNNIFGNDFAEVNIGRLQKAIDEKRLKIDGKITEEVLRKAGLAHKSRDGVRLLGKGDNHRQDRHRSGRRLGRRQRSGRKGRRQRHHHLQQDGLQQQEGRAGQAPEAPLRRRRQADCPQRPRLKSGSARNLRGGRSQPGAGHYIRAGRRSFAGRVE